MTAPPASNPRAFSSPVCARAVPLHRVLVSSFHFRCLSGDSCASWKGLQRIPVPSPHPGGTWCPPGEGCFPRLRRARFSLCPSRSFDRADSNLHTRTAAPRTGLATRQPKTAPALRMRQERCFFFGFHPGRSLQPIPAPSRVFVLRRPGWRLVSTVWYPFVWTPGIDDAPGSAAGPKATPEW